jgi:hypothetical protein
MKNKRFYSTKNHIDFKEASNLGKILGDIELLQLKSLDVITH